MAKHITTDHGVLVIPGGSPRITSYPTLYKKTSTGKIEQWSIWVIGNKIFTEHGQVGGKLIQGEETIANGKNIGKKNETTPEQQALAEAKAKWTKQKERKGYVEELERAQEGESDQEGGIAPMLAQPFSKHGDKLTYPLFAQPKLDGIRCIAMVKEDGVTLWTRTRKQIVAVPHIAEAIKSLNLRVGTILDGELYNHELKADFETIVSAVRKDEPAPWELAQKIQYHVYDIPSDDKGFKERHHRLDHLLLHAPGCIETVFTFLATDKEELVDIFEKYKKQGYEGAMARAYDGKYEAGKRSYHLQKLKEFDEKEYPIVAVNEGRGKMAGMAIFTCKTEDGVEFDVKLEGSLENLKKYLQDESTWKGYGLTVQFQGLTGKNKVPRFPVGKSIRNYE